ncbi:MAG: DMT family transporter [Defluviitaleaceae bacterium]|nr:DMT family transporter [Defluviitaleaceae bacterium]
MKKPTPRSLAIVFVFLAAAIWGASFVNQSIASQHMGAFTYNGVRFLLGALSILLVVFLFERARPDRAKLKKTWLVSVAGGVILFFAANLQQLGIVFSDSYTPAGEAGFITGMYIIFVPLLGIFLKQRVKPIVWVAAVLAFLGLFLITTTGGLGGITAFEVSHILLVICAVFWAVHILVIDRFVNEISPIRFASYQFVVAGALSIIVAIIFDDITWQGLSDGIWTLLFGGIVVSGVAYTLQILGQRSLEPTFAAIIFSLEALFAAISEAVWMGQAMTTQRYIGGGIILLGIILAQIKFKERRGG